MTTLLSLPLELRLQIFQQLLCSQRPSDPTHELTNSEDQENQELSKIHSNEDGRFIANARRPTLFMRNIDPLHYRQVATLTWPCWRTVYEIRCDRFRARVLDTTYQCLNTMTFGSSLDLLLVNNQIHTEAARLLYGGFTFDFDTHIEAIVPFLSDLTPFSRSCIKSISLIKRALAYEKDYDRCEWSSTMKYLADPRSGMSLQSLHVGIMAGRPGSDGWDNVSTYTANEFEALVHVDDMNWLKELIEIRGLQMINAYAVVKQSPPATASTAMADYIRFSASIDSGLVCFLQKHMLQKS